MCAKSSISMGVIYVVVEEPPPKQVPEPQEYNWAFAVNAKFDWLPQTIFFTHLPLKASMTIGWLVRVTFPRPSLPEMKVSIRK